MIIEHMAMYFDDIENAREFFIKYFGAAGNDGYHNARTGFRSYFLAFDGGARLEIMNKPDVLPGSGTSEHTGYSHIAFSTGSETAVDELTARLRTDGYAVLSGPRVTGDGYYESCIAGPEGNRIEITV